MRILIVEDDEMLAQTLGQHLVSQNYIVDLATDGESGWDYIQMLTYDLILLDIDLPRLDGLALCKRLRYHRHKEPVLLLTARSQIANRVQGLDAGADDYLIKPYSLDELLARVRALLRRQTRGAGEPVLTWGPLSLDLNLCELTVEEQAIALSPKEYQLMELFLRHPQQVLSSDRILDHIWGFEDAPGKDTVRTHMRRLRKKLKPLGADHWIETVYGLGYRLKAKDSNAPDGEKSAPPAIEEHVSAGEEEAFPVHIAQSPTTGSQDGTPIQPLDALAPDSVTSVDAARQASLSLWPKFRPKAIERLMILETAIASLEEAVINHPLQRHQLMGDLDASVLYAMQAWPLQVDEHLHRQGERAAHKLVGTLGMFGMPDGSELAGQIESLFQQLSPPCATEFGMVAFWVSQLRLKCSSLQHLLAVNAGYQSLDEEESLGLIHYPQARRDLSKYFCLARRHHHAIALAWVALKPANPPAISSPIQKQGQVLYPEIHEEKIPQGLSSQNKADAVFELVQPALNSLLLTWALSVKQSLREEDIVTQRSDNIVLLALYACSKENAFSRLNPFLKQLSKLIEQKAKDNSDRALGVFGGAKRPKKHHISLDRGSGARSEDNECGVGIDLSQDVIVPPPYPVLSAQLAEFPQDGQTLESLEMSAFHSNSYLERIPLLKVNS